MPAKTNALAEFTPNTLLDLRVETLDLGAGGTALAPDEPDGPPAFEEPESSGITRPTDLFALQGPEHARFWTPSGLSGAPGQLSTLELPVTRRAEVVSAPRITRQSARFIALQKWEGQVRALSSGEFEAVLADLTDPQRPPEVATFDISEVEESDHDLIAPGAVFYWNIGYEWSPWGERRRVSIIRFRRLPYWTRGELQEAVTKSEKWVRLLGE